MAIPGSAYFNITINTLDELVKASKVFSASLPAAKESGRVKEALKSNARPAIQVALENLTAPVYFTTNGRPKSPAEMLRSGSSLNGASSSAKHLGIVEIFSVAIYQNAVVAGSA